MPGDRRTQIVRVASQVLLQVSRFIYVPHTMKKRILGRQRFFQLFEVRPHPDAERIGFVGEVERV